MADVAFIAGLVGLFGYAFAQWRKIVRLLREQYPATWEDLGRPSPNALFSTGRLSRALFLRSGHQQLGDPVLSRHAQKAVKAWLAGLILLLARALVGTALGNV